MSRVCLSTYHLVTVSYGVKSGVNTESTTIVLIYYDMTCISTYFSQLLRVLGLLVGVLVYHSEYLEVSFDFWMIYSNCF